MTDHVAYSMSKQWQSQCMKSRLSKVCYSDQNEVSIEKSILHLIIYTFLTIGILILNVYVEKW
jgi:cell division protein FtsL